MHKNVEVIVPFLSVCDFLFLSILYICLYQVAFSIFILIVHFPNRNSIFLYFNVVYIHFLFFYVFASLCILITDSFY